jgi:hypothetical protein
MRKPGCSIFQQIPQLPKIVSFQLDYTDQLPRENSRLNSGKDRIKARFLQCIGERQTFSRKVE